MSSTSQWNISLDDTSPLFNYSSAFGLGWQTWYSGSGYNSESGQAPAGQSYHITTANGASMSFSFFGTAITLYGTANCTYDVTIDGSLHSSLTPHQTVLFSKSHLAPSEHVLDLTAHPLPAEEQSLAFTQAVITSVVNGSDLVPNPVSYDQTNNSIRYTGNWTTMSDPHVPSLEHPSPYRSAQGDGSSALFEFNGRAVVVRGPMTPTSGQYLITIDNETMTLDAHSSWLIPDTPLFFQDNLNASQSHTLNITNLSANSSVSLSSITVYNFSNTDNTSNMDSTSHRIAVIVGPVVAGVVVILIAALILGSKYYRKVVAQRKNSVLDLYAESPDSYRVSTANSDNAPSYLVELQSSNLYKNREINMNNFGGVPEERLERPGRVYVIRSDRSSRRAARAAILSRTHGQGNSDPDDQQAPLSPKFYSEP